MPPDTSTHATQQGALLIDAGRAQAALSHLHRAVAADPESVRAHCLIAVAHIELDDPARALDAAKTAVGLAPDGDWGHRLMALSLAMLGKKRQAKAAALEACRLAPGDAAAHIVLSRALQAARDEAGALAAAQRAIALDANEAETHHQLGLVLLAHNRLGEAEQAFLDTLALRPGHARALNNIGVVHRRQHRHAEAVDEFELAARASPDRRIARQNITDLGRIARLQRRIAVCFMVATIGCAAVGEASGALVTLAFALVFEWLHRSGMRRLDDASRALIADDARARRFHPLRWDWHWLLRLRPWWWQPSREIVRAIPAGVLLGANLALLALAVAALLAAAHPHIESAGGWAIPLATLLPFTLRRFRRNWRLRHPSKRSWRAGGE